MLYHSTNLKAEPVSFGAALLKGLAEDGGLFMPEVYPTFTAAELEGLRALDYPGIAFEVLHKFLADELPAEELRRLVNDAYDFPVPLEAVEGAPGRHVMRLDQGPTASFKDFAARMMGRLMQHFLGKEGRRLLILTATSGDTGSAIANAFYGLDNIQVVVLFPTTEVTARQRKQMTTLGRNIRVLSLDGKFDDCQALVKLAFNDRELDGLALSSANSINIGRLLPQAVYYFHAWAKLAKPGEEVVFSVPSGNFGDLMGGLIAKKMGLPVRRFVVATNENDEFPLYWENGEYHVIAPSRNCISSAMNVGHPSNVARLIAMYGGVMDEKGRIHRPADLDAIRRDLYAVSVTDAQTEATIRDAWRDHRLLLEPHGAVAWAGLGRWAAAHRDEDGGRTCVSVETAHPAKFPEKIIELLGFDPALPPSLTGLDDKPEHVAPLENDYPAFKAMLQEKYGS